MKKQSRKILFLRIIKIIFIALIIVSLINILIWYQENNKTKEITQKAKKYINISDNNKINPKIKTINEDIIGWLIVDNTSINYPIVQTNNNEYYLNHNLEKEYSSAGWIFMDSNNKLDDQNIVIYGHHRRDGSMFGSIDNLLNKHKGGKIHLIINDKTIEYNIFSIYKTDKEYNYRNRNYNNLKKQVQDFKNKSLVEYNVDTKNINQIITLSTCDTNNIERIVVNGVKNN